MSILSKIFPFLDPIGKIADAIDRIVRMFEKWWDARQIANIKTEAKQEAARETNIKTYEQLDDARAVKDYAQNAEEAAIDEILLKGPKP